MITRARWLTFGSVLVLALLLGHPATAAEEAESPPVRTASQILGAERVKGPGYTIRERVDPCGFLNHYEVESSFGLYEAHSDRMLTVRLREIETMQRLMKMSSTNTYMASLQKRLVALPNSLVQVATNPVKAIGRVPKVVGNTFGRVGSFLGGVGKGGKSPDDIRKALVAAQKRRLAIELKVDVYSTNPKLQQLLDDVATARYAGEMTVSLASYAIPGGAGTAVYSAASYNADIVQILADKTEEELIAHNGKLLRGLGVHAFVVRKFFEAPHLSPRHETTITAAMGRMRGVKGLGAVAEAAIEAADETRALLQEQQAFALAHYHTKREPLAELQADGGVVVARTRSGRAVVLAPVDLVWDDAASSAVLAALARVPLMRAAPQRDLEIKGRVTQRFVDAAKARGFRVISGWPGLPRNTR